ncbi:ABC-2 family transporter protein [Butyrivibrio sp. INlla16]|uniref:ABC transporter permease n=1 Tax=Butyrivibrio sp. INlla16 TaxID=1520807 RepID=UPI000886CD32|nr:ABC-2 family transporter protein [Butyrivibrio sp. INlla16]SDB68321.1 ABC-2 family transporter protein [Butyrivibrio sp. INlla16]
MRKYADLAMIGIKEHTAYLNSVWANFLSKIVYLYMQFSLWNALFSSNAGRVIPLSRDETIRYIIVATLISTFMKCDVIAWINSQIQSGDVANQLIRPIDYKLMIFAKHIGTSLARIVIYTLPLGIVISVFYHGKIFCEEQLLYGIISILLAYMIQFLYSLIIGLMAFWLIVTWPLNMLLAAIYKLLSGSWIPAAMFPEFLAAINAFLPFRAIYAIPVTIITTPMSFENLCENLCVQLIWMAALFLLSEVCWFVGKNKLVVQGG